MSDQQSVISNKRFNVARLYSLMADGWEMPDVLCIGNIRFDVLARPWEALPRPGTDEQLYERVARLQSRPLDRNRPLWEMNIVEGLSDGRFAVVTGLDVPRDSGNLLGRAVERLHRADD